MLTYQKFKQMMKNSVLKEENRMSFELKNIRVFLSGAFVC